MKITVNGETKQVQKNLLSDILVELGFADSTVATAVNENFIALSQRASHPICDGDRIEIVAPMQGG